MSRYNIDRLMLLWLRKSKTELRRTSPILIRPVLAVSRLAIIQSFSHSSITFKRSAGDSCKRRLRHSFYQVGFYRASFVGWSVIPCAS